MKPRYQPSGQEAEEGEDQIIRNISDHEPHGMIRRFKIEGLDRVGEEADRELEPVGQSEYQEADKEGEAGFAGSDRAYG